MRDGEGVNSEGKYVGKKCRLQLYHYPKSHKFTSGISEVSLYMYLYKFVSIHVYLYIV